VEYDYPRMDIELAPSMLYTMAKPLTKRGERFLRDRYIADDKGRVVLCALGGFRRAADSMALRVYTARSAAGGGPGHKGVRDRS